MATNEKSHALGANRSESEERAGPAACRRVARASNYATDTFFYLNSVIDWPFNHKLHAAMVQNPSWRVKRANGSDVTVVGNNWAYNLSHPDCRTAWLNTCVQAVRDGCTGCFIDQANVNEAIAGNDPAAQRYSRDHLRTLDELSEILARTNNYAIMNHLGVKGNHTHAMMVEDWDGSEKCINMLRTLAARGLTVQAHAGNSPVNNTCVNAGTNSLAAFLIGAGDRHFYHCAGPPMAWGSRPDWQPGNGVKDEWLDWPKEYDYKLGAPMGAPSQSPIAGTNASLWSREFASGTRVLFDGALGNGTIYWSNGGPVQTGLPTQGDPTVQAKGCRWEAL